MALFFKIKKGVAARLITLTGLLITGLFLPKLISGYPQFVEKIFAQGLFLWISTAMGAITSVLSFSIVEFLLYALIISAVFALAITLINVIKRRIGFKAILNGLLTLCIIAGVLLNLFYFMWGFNYWRPTVGDLIGLNITDRSESELYELCVVLRDEANLLRRSVPEDENGVFTIDGDLRELFLSVADGYAALGDEISLFSRRVYSAKPVLNSRLMSYAGIAGIFVPFTAEANVNRDQPALYLLSSAAHENAHYLGFARENEANFIAYLACSYSSDPRVKYSGTMAALHHCSSKLYSADINLYNALREGYSDGLRRDINDYSRYWKSFEGEIQDVATTINDNYLKHNDQLSGVQSYGEVVDLLLAYYFANS